MIFRLMKIFCQNRLPIRSTFGCVCKRNYQLPPAVFETEKKLSKKDGVLSDSELIYKFTSPNVLIGFLSFTNATVIVSPLLGAIIYCERNGVINLPSESAVDSTSSVLLYLSEIECYTSIAALMIVCFLLNRYCSLHPIRVYSHSDGDKYTAVFLNSIIPWKTKKHVFSVTRKAFQTTLLDEKRAILYAEHFKKPLDYNKLCHDY